MPTCKLGTRPNSASTFSPSCDRFVGLALVGQRFHPRRVDHDLLLQVEARLRRATSRRRRRPAANGRAARRPGGTETSDSSGRRRTSCHSRAASEASAAPSDSGLVLPGAGQTWTFVRYGGRSPRLERDLVVARLKIDVRRVAAVAGRAVAEIPLRAIASSPAGPTAANRTRYTRPPSPERSVSSMPYTNCAAGRFCTSSICARRGAKSAWTNAVCGT